MKRFWCLLGVLAWAQPYKDLEGHAGPINAVAFTYDSHYLLSAGSDRQVVLWSIPGGDLVSRFQGATASVNGLALLPDSSGVFWGASSDGKLYQWRIRKPSEWRAENWSRVSRDKAVDLSKRLQKTGPPILWEAVTIHPRKPLLFALSRYGRLVSWDIQEEWLQTYTDTAEVAYALAMPTHGKVLYLASGSGAIYALDPSDLSTKEVLRGHRDGVRGLAISYDDRLLASAGLDGKVMVWQLPEGLRIRTLEGHKDGVRAVSFSPDGRYLASAGRDGLLCIWDVATGQLAKSLSLPSSLWAVAFSPNGQYLVAGGSEGFLRLWRIDQLGIRPAQILSPRDELYTPPLVLEDDVPVCQKPRPYRYAYIIGNEDYRLFQPTFTPAMNVPYAVRDAYTFRVYAEQILGIPPQNIVFLQNATSAQMRRELDKLLILAQASRGEAEIFFYYAGHGVPHPETKESYLLPTDASPRQPEEGGLRLTDIIRQLAESGAHRVWLVVDACFSGGAREESPLASRGIRIRPRPIQLRGPTVLLAASSADQEALPYHQAQHGLFTYFLLKALRESCGSKSLKAIFEQARLETTRYGLLLHEKLQEPTLLVSPALPETVLSESW